MELTRYISDNVPSILDLIITNEENMVLNLSTLPGLSKSDHVILNFNFNCYTNVQSATFKKYNLFKGKYLPSRKTSEKRIGAKVYGTYLWQSPGIFLQIKSPD